MTMTNGVRASPMAVLTSFVLLSLSPTSCHRPSQVAPAARPSAMDAPSHPVQAQKPFDRAIAILEERTGEHLALVMHEHDYTSMHPAWLPDNRLVVPSDRGVTIVDPRSGAIADVSAKGRRAVVSPDGKTMAIASSVEVELLDVASGRSLARLDGSVDDNHDGSIQFSPDSKTFAFALRGSRDTGKLLGLYDTAKRALRGTLVLAGPMKHAPALTAKFAALPEESDSVVTFELRDERIVASLFSGKTALWDTSSCQLLLLLAGTENDLEAQKHPALISEDGSFVTAWTPVDSPASNKRPAQATVPAGGAPGGGIIHAKRRLTPLLIDARQGEVIMRLEDKQCEPFGIAMHPREPVLAVGSLYPGFCVWDLAKRKIKQRFRIRQATPGESAPGAGLMLRLAAAVSPKMDLPMQHVAFDASGEHLVLAVDDLGDLVVKLSDGRVSEGALSKDSHWEDFPGRGPSATSPDRTMIAGSGNEPRVWDVATGRVIRRMVQHEKHAHLAWTPAGLTLVGVEGTVVRFGAATGELAERRPRPAGFDDVKTVSNGAGTLVMLSSHPAGLRVLRLDDPGKITQLAWPGPVDGVLAAAGSDIGRIAVAASDKLVVFEEATGAALRAIEPRGPNPLETNTPTDLALDDDGQLVAAVVQRTPRLWEVASGKEIALPPGDCTGLKFRPKTRLLVGLCGDKVRVWDGRTGASVSAIDNADLANGLFFDAAGARIAQLGAQHLTLIDGVTLATLTQTASQLPTSTAVFSPSSRTVAVGIQNGEGVLFYRVADGKKLARLQMWPNDEAWIVRSEQGQVEIFGDVERVQRELECRVGKHVLPAAACEDRFIVKGLLAQVLSEKIADSP